MGRHSLYDAKREDLLTEIAKAHSAHSKPPTVRELADASGVGVATMHAYLGRLADEGLISWQPKSHRSLRLTPQGHQQLSA